MNPLYPGIFTLLSSQLSNGKRICSVIGMAIVLLSVQIAGAQSVTGIITDYNGYWKSTAAAINSVKPDNSNNLLAFTYNGTTYSTGVNDGALASHGESFIPSDFWSLPVSNISGTITSNTKIGLGQKYDGVSNGPSNPAPSNNISGYLIDGIKGLDIGTCVANLPAGSMTFLVSNISPSCIGDGVPDILITQVADPSSSTDRYQFTNSAGTQVGNYKDVSFTSIAPVGNWTADFYDASTNPLTLAPGFTNTDRPLRLWAADLSDFGITLANYQSVTNFKVGLSGNSDVAFVAYGSTSFSLIHVLPVEIAEFNAKKVGATTQLSWVTHSENNTGWFVIEKSTGNGIFTAIDSVPAAGLSSGFHSYTYTDKFLIEGNNHYRLKSVDIDGAFDYSIVVSVRGDDEDVLFAIYPNPAAQGTQATVKYEAAKGTSTLKIYNIAGIMLSQQSIAKGSWQTTLALKGFSKGVFYIVWEDGPRKKTQKIIIN